MWQRVKKSLVFTFYFMFVFIIVLNFVRAGRNDSGRPQGFFGYYLFTVESGSMGEFMPVGSLVIVKKQALEKYKADDVITYQIDDALVTHRIIKIDDKGFVTTKGDENNTIDDKFSWLNILGKVVLVSVAGGRIVDIARNPLTILIIIVLLIFYLLFGTILEMIKDKKKKKEGKEENKDSK